ncbi:MAG: phosphoribosylamine--glycine ligase [Chloroflexi bacterium]|nr:phosphoribosylamine--glycine ligase [Chloroflexota bacterium]
MRVLVVGSGGREHAIAWKLAQSKLLSKLYCAPGNAGIAQVAQNVPLAADDCDGLAAWAEQNDIDLTVVGPEAPLSAGIANQFHEKGLAVFGPTKAAARIESSKDWCKSLLLRYGIPTAASETFTSYDRAAAYVSSRPSPIVIKADGLAGGKGVVVAQTRAEALQALEQFMLERTLGEAGNKVVVEEFLSGREVSLLAFTDGTDLLRMVPACDYKRVYDGDRGPNTGGMGAYSPPGFVSDDLLEDVEERILRQTIKAMAAEGCPYQGVLYAGLMITEEGPKVLEFNCRFGDPETQVILPRMEGDLLSIMNSVARGRLGEAQVAWSDRASCGVVLASGGYPGGYSKGHAIRGLDRAEEVVVFHAGTQLVDGKIVTAGGRVLVVVALGRDLAEARAKAYAGVNSISFEGCHFRTDIALREVG